MATDAGEVPFLTGMEREPCETTIKVGKKLFLLDGMVERLLQKARMAMARPERGPDPDAITEDDERIMVSVRSIESLLRRVGPGPGSVNGSRILTALVALNTALLVGIGGWLLVTVSQHDKDIAVIKCQLSPQCREALARAAP
jgi:hypothetical protein